MSQASSQPPSVPPFTGTNPPTENGSQAPPQKPRSCVVCRNRRVRCDKQSPCSNCRRAGIACIFPPADRPPRWARRLDRFTEAGSSSSTPNIPAAASQENEQAIGKVVERVQNLEKLVNELRDQLKQAHSAADQARQLTGFSRDFVPDPAQGGDQTVRANTGDTGPLNKQFGRLVIQDASQSYYVSSGFWSEINDEVSLPPNPSPAIRSCLRM